MNIGKFSSLYNLLEAFPTEESCIKYLEQHAGQMVFLFLLVSLRPKYITVAMECTDVRIRARTSMSE